MAGILRRAGADAGKRPARRDTRQEPPKKSVKARSRRVQHGATRNPVAREKTVEGGKIAIPSVWLNRLLILLGAAVVLTAGIKAFVTVQSLPVQRISVTGELEHTQAQLVQDIVQPGLVGGFLNADLKQIQRQLEGLPWIYEANVRRKWPNALEIHVVEELPIARWGQDGFLNHEGGVFHSDKEGDWASLPRLQGSGDSARSMVQKYQRLVEILAPFNLAVEQLTEDERGQLEVVLAGGMQLNLGSDRFLERMHRFVEIYRNELSARQADVARVDLRYENGIAVAFKEPTQADPSSVAGI